MQDVGSWRDSCFAVFLRPIGTGKEQNSESAWGYPASFAYKGLGGFGILRHPPTQDQATHPDPPPSYKHLRGGLRRSPGAQRLPSPT